MNTHYEIETHYDIYTHRTDYVVYLWDDYGVHAVKSFKTLKGAENWVKKHS